MRMVEFYFDFASPYGFLAAMQIEQMQRPVVWRPFLLGAFVATVARLLLARGARHREGHHVRQGCLSKVLAGRLFDC